MRRDNEELITIAFQFTSYSAGIAIFSSLINFWANDKCYDDTFEISSWLAVMCGESLILHIGRRLFFFLLLLRSIFFPRYTITYFIREYFSFFWHISLDCLIRFAFFELFLFISHLHFHNSNELVRTSFFFRFRTLLRELDQTLSLDLFSFFKCKKKEPKKLFFLEYQTKKYWTNRAPSVISRLDPIKGTWITKSCCIFSSPNIPPHSLRPLWNVMRKIYRYIRARREEKNNIWASLGLAESV